MGEKGTLSRVQGEMQPASKNKPFEPKAVMNTFLPSMHRTNAI